MRLLPYILAKLNAMPSLQRWLGLRISYGMNGILLRSSDLKSFATYMRYVLPNVLSNPTVWYDYMSCSDLSESARIPDLTVTIVS